MLFKVEALIAPFYFLAAASCVRFDWETNGSQTRLRGNSFGSGYVNATYDYIVRISEPVHFLAYSIDLISRSLEVVQVDSPWPRDWPRHRMSPSPS